MNDMEDSMAQPGSAATAPELPGWKLCTGGLAAVLLALLFLVAGIWKITDPFGAAERLAQAKIPHFWSLPAALSLGIAETFAGVLLFVPRFRRWGAYLTGLLLVAFLAYMGLRYNVLRGEECNCFPWIKRAVGPAFFIGDLIMLALALAAGAWSRASRSLRYAVLTLAAVAVFSGVSFGVSAVRNSGLRAPATIQVDGKAYPLDEGKIFLYFFDPECAHCDAAARRMAKYNWKDTKVIGVPTARMEFARQFMDETGLRAPFTTDAALLRKTFLFIDSPYAVALYNGRQTAAFQQFDEQEPRTGLRKIAFAE